MDEEQYKGSFEILLIADPHQSGDAINEFLQKLKKLKIENLEDPESYSVYVEDAWVYDEEGMRLDYEEKEVA